MPVVVVVHGHMPVWPEMDSFEASERMNCSDVELDNRALRATTPSKSPLAALDGAKADEAPAAVGAMAAERVAPPSGGARGGMTELAAVRPGSLSSMTMTTTRVGAGAKSASARPRPSDLYDLD